MTARIERIQLHHPIGLRKSLVGLCLVTRLPVIDMVVRLAFFLVADQRRARLERVLRADNRREDLIVDLDQRRGVARHVRVRRDDAGDFWTAALLTALTMFM